MQNPFSVLTLSQGVQLVHLKTYHSPVSHCALMMGLGSRDEPTGLEGLSHLWEHMLFKGTEKRSASQIISRIENYGGEINAYTTKENVVIHASVPSKQTAKTIDLLAELVGKGRLPERELAREKEVIREEIRMYEDLPEEMIFEEAEGRTFEGSALAHPILGTFASLENMGSDALRQYIGQQLHPSRVVLAVASPWTSPQLEDACNSALDQLHFSGSSTNRKPVTPRHFGQASETRDFAGAHVCMSTTLPVLTGSDRMAWHIAINTLAGAGMNSRLNQALRERNGLVYTVEGSLSGFQDLLHYTVYYSCEQRKLPKAKRLVERELDRLYRQGLSKRQLAIAREQVKGQLALSSENYMATALSLGKALLDQRPLRTLPELLAILDDLTVEQVAQLVGEHLNPEQFSTLTYLPSE